MTFIHPSFLWAFTALAIPLAIHLLSRKEGKVIRVGSLRHVEESNTSQFKSLRLNEILLLLLRCLMVTMVVLFLAGAQWNGSNSQNVKWVVAEKGIDVDSLISKGYEFHEMPKENYWSYVEELNKLPHDIIVVSYSKAENFNGKRIPLAANIKWISAQSFSARYPALAWSAGDSVLYRDAMSNFMTTSFKTEIGVADSIEVIKPRDVNVSTSDKIVIAALNVLKKEYKLPIEISGSGQPVTNIKVAPNIGPLVERLSSTEIRINKSLDQDIAVNDNLVIELFKVLYPELQKPEVKKDARVLPDEFAFSKQSSSSGQLAISFGIERYLVISFLLLLMAERVLAIRRNQ
jgi:hypothetical protein